MCEKSINMNKCKEIPYNILLLPTLICFVQFCFIFVALINSGYSFEWKILIASFSTLMMWTICYIISSIRQKVFFRFDFKKFFTYGLGFVLGFYFVHLLWFGGYLNLEPVKTLVEGNTHIDTLFHVSIAESFITNGFPSINFNEPTYLSYHTFSHFIIAGISLIVRVPVFITYNYLYPIVFIPLYVFCLQLALREMRRQHGVNVNFSIADVVFIFLLLIGFLPENICYASGILFMHTFVSESCCVSMILLFSTIYFVVRFLPLNSKKSMLVRLFFLPIAIMVISWTKISTSLILYGYVCYILFRRNPKSIHNWSFIIFYTVVFLVSYFLFSGSGDMESFGRQFFHYARTYISSFFYIPFHYLYLLFFPVLLYTLIIKEKIFSRQYFFNSDNIPIETSLVVSIAASLPGILFTIGHGSAFYFCIPAFIMSAMIFFQYGGLSIVISSSNIKIYRFTLCCFFIYILFIFGGLHIKGMIFSTIGASNRNEIDMSNDIFEEKLKIAFSASELLGNPLFVQLEKLRSVAKESKYDYCIFLADDWSLGQEYKNQITPPEYAMRRHFVLTAYTGIPVINALSFDGVNIYRSDNVIIGKHGDDGYYGLSSVKKHDKVLTEADAVEFATNIGKKYLLVLDANGLRMINL